MLKCFNETIVSTNTLKKSGDRNLNRYEFLEILVRIAQVVNREQNLAMTPSQISQKKSLSQTLDHLLNEVVLQKAKKVNRYKFRRFLLHDPTLGQLVNRNIDVLEAAFNYFTHERKKYVSLEECVALAR